MSDTPLMPKATAVWLIDNTSITFEQIADFCGMHVLEVKGIADEDVAKGIKGIDPVSSGQLTHEQIAEAEKDLNVHLKLAPPKHKLPPIKAKKTPRYTPVSKRPDKPDAIYWLLRNHPEVTDADIMRLIGTTKATISKIRDRGHWNSQNIKAVDPVTLGLSTQIELDFIVSRAANLKPRVPRKTTARLKPAEETTADVAMPGENIAETAPAEASAPAESSVPAEATTPKEATTPEEAPQGEKTGKQSSKPSVEQVFAPSPDQGGSERTGENPGSNPQNDTQNA